ncbi:hypothetical protein C2G38_2032750 [Gigaspora rosea]|uniref:Uncharacterized protein n=1 Tax=Gigaspora rosea TaxID=44941 RepID=A0A397VLU1_9GLOM|nr:hypothetical protein C2G38_2032750 [Gigaspora rosea]
MDNLETNNDPNFHINNDSYFYIINNPEIDFDNKQTFTSMMIQTFTSMMIQTFTLMLGEYPETNLDSVAYVYNVKGWEEPLAAFYKIFNIQLANLVANIRSCLLILLFKLNVKCEPVKESQKINLNDNESKELGMMMMEKLEYKEHILMIAEDKEKLRELRIFNAIKECEYGLEE